jgi:cell division protein FtsQ
MANKLKTSIEAKKNRFRRRFVDGIVEFVKAMGILLSVAVLALSFIYVYGFLLSTPFFAIKETSVRGVKELTEKEVLTLAGIKPQQNLLALNTETLVRRVATNPWVKNIYVGKELPNRIVLEVWERVPVALVKQEEDFYLIDIEGNIFKKLAVTDEVDLPVLTSSEGEDVTKARLLLSSLNLLKSIAASKQYAYLGSISEVNVDDLFGMSMLTDSGMHLKLGMDGFENKLKQLKVVMTDLEKRGLKNGFFSIDLCDANKITVARKDALGKTEMLKKGKKYRT